MLTAQLSYCQRTYPSKSVIDGDTVISVTLDHAQKINVTYFQMQQCAEMLIQSDSIADVYQRLADAQTLQIGNLKQQIVLKSDIITQKDGIIDNLNERITILNRKNTMNKFERNVLFVVGALLTFQLLR